MEKREANATGICLCPVTAKRACCNEREAVSWNRQIPFRTFRTHSAALLLRVRDRNPGALWVLSRGGKYRPPAGASKARLPAFGDPISRAGNGGKGAGEKSPDPFFAVVHRCEKRAAVRCSFASVRGHSIPRYVAAGAQGFPCSQSPGKTCGLLRCTVASRSARGWCDSLRSDAEVSICSANTQPVGAAWRSIRPTQRTAVFAG